MPPLISCRYITLYTYGIYSSVNDEVTFREIPCVVYKTRLTASKNTKKFPYIPRELIDLIFTYLPIEYGMIILGHRYDLGDVDCIIHRDHVYYISCSQMYPTWDTYETHTRITLPSRFYVSQYCLHDVLGNVINFTKNGIEFKYWKEAADSILHEISHSLSRGNFPQKKTSLQIDRGAETFKTQSVGQTRYYRMTPSVSFVKNLIKDNMKIDERARQQHRKKLPWHQKR